MKRDGIRIRITIGIREELDRPRTNRWFV